MLLTLFGNSGIEPIINVEKKKDKGKQVECNFPPLSRDTIYSQKVQQLGTKLTE